MTTWAAEDKEEEATTLADAATVVKIQTQGYFSWRASSLSGSGWETTTDYTDAEHLVFIQQHGYLSPYVSGAESIWSAVSEDTSLWTPVVQSGTVAAQFELREPIGGPIWTAVTKD